MWESVSQCKWNQQKNTMSYISKLLLYVTVSILVVALYMKNRAFTKNDSAEMVCSVDFIRNVSVCRPVCPRGYFALPGMVTCHPWLNCGTKIIPLLTLSVSVVKTIYLARWKQHTVVLSVLSSKEFEDDFMQNIYMLRNLASHSHIVQLLGYCNNNSILTEYHDLGSALNTNYHLMHTLKSYDTVKVRLNFCISYVTIIQFLHTSPLGIRVMCDSNTLEKTLSQYLLTSDLKLVINDLDATPVVNNITGRGVHCGNRPLSGSFVAPEQLWPYASEEYDSQKLPLYDEKTDIYKIPDVCNWFLGNSSDADLVKYKLFNIHKMCKDFNPASRPTAGEILKAYQEVLRKI
ncbi:protein O-mannose kinase-like isoform X2 [Stegodyphus dumicola]|nr:protein O-mannose kinase-like isoform X2 [Stegodyphus dumicola]